MGADAIAYTWDSGAGAILAGRLMLPRTLHTVATQTQTAVSETGVGTTGADGRGERSGIEL